MTRPIAPADVPAWAWSELRQLPELRAERDLLIGWRSAMTKSPRHKGGRQMRGRIREITLDILRREVRLASTGIDPARGVDLPAAVRPYSETER